MCLVMSPCLLHCLLAFWHSETVQVDAGHALNVTEKNVESFRLQHRKHNSEKAPASSPGTVLCLPELSKVPHVAEREVAPAKLAASRMPSMAPRD